MTHLARLLRLVGRGDPQAAHDAAARLARARASAEKWKARAAELTAHADEAAGRLAGMHQELRDAQARGDSLYRETPSVPLVRATFAHRLRTLRVRTDAARSSQREAAFVRVAPSYAAALDAGSGVPRPAADQVTVDGVTWWVPSGTGSHRLPYRTILQTREVSSGGIMLDLGANIGRMAIPRVVFGDVTAAYCAEPDPVNFACLARTVIDNGLRGLVLPDQTAIGDRTGTVRLLREGSSGNFRVLPEAARQPATREIVDVPCCTLDEWVARLGIDLDAVTFVKVDVEGFERRVVAGAKRVLACPHIAWQMEIKPAGLRGAGDDPEGLFADLRHAFTHFIDLSRHAAGKRTRPVAELREALAYVEPDGKTDVLLFTLSELRP